jgi:hypothetical protein
MKKTTFVPSADCLESRIAMSGGIQYIGGLPVLTSHALSETYSAILRSYTTFATRGLNYNLLSFNLGNAVSRIPYNVRDGLRATVQGEVSGLLTNIQTHVFRPVVTSYEATIDDVRSFVQSEVADGIFVFT